MFLISMYHLGPKDHITKVKDSGGRIIVPLCIAGAHFHNLQDEIRNGNNTKLN